MVKKMLKLCLILCLLLTKANATRQLSKSSAKLYGEDEYLLNTPGCIIPNMWKKYKIVEADDCENVCGIRAVRIARKAKDNIIKYIIDEKEMHTFFGKTSYKCCYQFGYRLPDDTLGYTKCKRFRHGTSTKLEEELVTVTCKLKENKTNHDVYKDSYIVPKIQKGKGKKVDKTSWNVLIFGMGSMSRARAIQSMPKLVDYFKQNSWLDYRAFQKVTKSTFANVMNLLTGKSSSTYNLACKGNMSRCNDLMIWSEFKKRGYVTAYGADHLPDTFRTNNEFQLSPTDHYTRPLLLLDEVEEGNLVCIHKKPAAHHVLSYAEQFVRAYKDEKLFGFFWMISYSHNPNHIPTLLQNYLIQLFNNLKDIGLMNSTIIFFLSDHGVSFGKLKLPVASHYDDKLPMLFMWIPYSFRKRFKTKYKNLQVNQERLTTHCDVYSTMRNILKLSDRTVKMSPPEVCPKCSSLFRKISINRNCEDINVSEKWCSCHVLNPVHSIDDATKVVPKVLMSKVSKKTKHSVLENVLRHHWYRNSNDEKNLTYYVIAVQVAPGERQYEATIYKTNKSEYKVLNDIDIISPTSIYYDTSVCKPA